MKGKPLLLAMLSILLPLCCSGALPGYTQLPADRTPVPRYGTIERYAVASAYLNDEITVDVWLPASYSDNAAEPFPVIYAHDGDSLFDPEFAPGGVEWQVDLSCNTLAYNKDFRQPVVVGICNRGNMDIRASDYFPEKALDYIAPQDRSETYIYSTCYNKFNGDEEAAFVALELKPLIDSLYNVSRESQYTFAMGSSMGALASLYLMCEYPDIFGGAICLSTHWIGSLGLDSSFNMKDDSVCANALLEYMRLHLPSPATHRLYLDQGSIGWDAMYLKYEDVARQIARDHGYNEQNATLMTHNASGADHNSWFWRQRLHIPLRFMLTTGNIDLAGAPEIEVSPRTDGMIYDLSGRAYQSGCQDRLPRGYYIIGGEKVAR